MLPILPQVVCLTEHHLKDQEIANFSMANYTLKKTFKTGRYMHFGA